MDAIRTLKAFIARLARAPLAARDVGVGAPDRSPRECTTRQRTIEPPTTKQRTTKQRTTKQRDGDEGEAFARRVLERAGLAFVAANVCYRDGEIDLVMRAAHGVLVFVEVRRRAGSSHGGAAGSVTREKCRRVVAAASHYLVGLGVRALPTCRFDVVTIEGDARQGFRVDWIRDAFRDDGSVL